MRLVRALAALATLALLVVGVPVLLLALGNPQDLLVLEWPSALLRPDDGRALLALLSVVGWLAWALLLATIAAELVTELTRGQVKLRLPGTGWLRPLVVPLVAAMLAPLLTLLAQDTPAAALAQPAATQPASAAVMTPTEAEEEAEPAGEVQDAAEQVRVHVVGPEDDLWTLAEQYLGSGPRWREISRVNPELDPLAALPVGYELRLPAGAVLPEQAAAANPGPESVPTAAVETRATAAPIGAPAASDTPVATGPLPTAPTSNLPGAAIEQEPASPADSDAEAAPGPATGEAESPRTVVVQRGDTLWDLAAEHLGDPELWPKIAAANQDIIEDPDLIDIGWVLTIPDLPQPEAAAAAEEPAAAPAVPAETQPVSEPGLPLLPGERPADAAADSADLAPASEGISLLNPPASALPPAPIPDNGDTDVPRNAEVAATQATAQPGRNETPAELTASRTSPPPSADPETAVTSATPASPGDASGRLLGPIGAVLAASIFVGIGARRRAQLLQRAVGRRIIPVRPQLQRFWASLAATADHSGKPRRFAPTSLVVGWNAKADVVVNLEQARLLPVAAPADLAAGFAAAAITGLTCASWSDTVEVIAVTPDERWDTAIDDPRLRVSDTTEVAIAELAERCTERQRELGKTNLASARGDADTRDAFAPVVFVWCRPVARPDFDRIQATLTAAEVGVSAVVPVEPPPNDIDCLEITDSQASWRGQRFDAQLIDAPARRALVELFTAAGESRTEPAPWWGAAAVPDNIAVLPAAKQTALSSSARTGDSPVEPTLLLLGPVDLVGTRGRPPSRARKQCIEYCAWLHTHPAARPTEMVADLLVAETTRRSNMSRLRSWLGESPEGHQYLPDAYSGVIDLAPEVTSDWERLQSLISGGVRSASTASLIEALGMVRGEPLAQVWFQWGWAAQLRTDMLSLIADVAAVLADRYLSLGDAAGAIWAVQQGQLATGPDEILASRRIEALALAGEATKLERAVRDLTRQAKAEGRDLSAETTRRVQRALSSQLRRTGS